MLGYDSAGDERTNLIASAAAPPPCGNLSGQLLSHETVDSWPRIVGYEWGANGQ